MKNTILILVPILLLALISASPAATEYHDFLCKDGRTFRGQIVAYDHHSSIVSIQRDNKRLIKVSPDIFDKVDQVYIKEWNIIRCFQSEHLFKVSAGRYAVKGEKVSRYKYLRNTHYNIVMENGSATPFQNMTVEYRIYYTCKQTQGIMCGKFLVSEMDPGSKRKVRTPRSIPSKLSSEKKISIFGNPYYTTAVDGIWLRITLPLSGGRKVAREYCLPDSISKHRKWATVDLPIVFNKQ